MTAIATEPEVKAGALVRPETDTAGNHPLLCVGFEKEHPEHHDNYMPHHTMPTTLDYGVTVNGRLAGRPKDGAAQS